MEILQIPVKLICIVSSHSVFISALYIYIYIICCLVLAPPSYEEYIYAKPGILQSPNYAETDHIEDQGTIDTGIGVSNESEGDQIITTSPTTASQSIDDVTSAPFASHDSSPNEDALSSRALSYDSMFSDNRDSLPMFISHLQEQNRVIQDQPQSLFQPPQHLHLDGAPFQPRMDASLTSITSTPSSSAPRRPLGIRHQQPMQDLDNISGHFSEISLSSPQDSLIGARARDDDEDEEEHGQRLTELSALVSHDS